MGGLIDDAEKVDSKDRIEGKRRGEGSLISAALPEAFYLWPVAVEPKGALSLATLSVMAVQIFKHSNVLRIVVVDYGSLSVESGEGS
jgi:hypothetical protein